MNSVGGIAAAVTAPVTGRRAGFLERALRAPVLERLAGIADGRLVLIDEDGGRHVFGTPGPRNLEAVLRVRDPGFWPAIALGGSVGAGDAWTDGLWTADDLVACVRILVRNRAVLDGLETGLARLAVPALRWFHAARRNTREGARRNIADHYDLGNDLFRLFLDPTMTYSCAFWEHPEQTLEQAQIAKIDRLLDKLDLHPEHHLLEIGTGWGALAIRAAERHGCRVTTTTLSAEQHAVAQERVRAAGLEDRVTLLLRDFRDLQGRYDRIVSVEMIEAVGHELFPEFFRRCRSLLAPDGRIAIQAITIRDDLYEDAKRSVDFIKRRIFPGSTIPSVTAMMDAVAANTDLRLLHLEDIGPHYVRTLREWRERFLARADDVRALGYPDRFLRLWEFYLAYCEGGYEERALGDVHLLLAGPEERTGAPLPPLR